jgi:hypothetical protein
MALMKLDADSSSRLDKDSARKFKLKKESTMVYLDDKLETSDPKKNGASNGPDAMTTTSENQYAQAQREQAESAKGYG